MSFMFWNSFIKDVEQLDEQINKTSGKFDEINSILSVTQQRLNKFKVNLVNQLNAIQLISFSPDSLWQLNEFTENTWKSTN